MGRYLLDTHTFLWWLADEPDLAQQARAVLADERNEIFVSAVTGWEIAIKRSLGKLEAPTGLDQAVIEAGFSHLPVEFHHGETAGALPDHHRDPFDRMLIAQALAEHLVIVTRDSRLAPYQVETVAA